MAGLALYPVRLKYVSTELLFSYGTGNEEIRGAMVG